MQRLFHQGPEDGRAGERHPEELDLCRLAGGWLWLDLADPADDEVWRVGELFGFDALSLGDVIDITLLPKVDEHDRYLFVVLHGILAGSESRLSTTELDLFIGRDFLVTMHYGPIAAIDWVAEHLNEMDDLANDGPGLVAARIAEFGSRGYLPLLDALEQRIEELEDDALAGNPRLLGENQALRRDVIVLRRMLGPQRDVLFQLGRLGLDILGQGARRGFADVYDHNFKLVESLDAARALLGSVLETYRGAVAERTNEIMKVLTVFSAILLPLALVAGLWGMNFANLPGAGWRWGFLTLLGGMATVAALLWVYFVRRGFVGGPRIRDLPKATGLSLVALGTAPLRAVTKRRDQVDAPVDSPGTDRTR